MSNERMRVGGSALVALIACVVACGDDDTTLPDASHSSVTDAGARDASARDGELGNVDWSDPIDVPRPDDPGGEEDLCTTGSAIGAGVMSGSLEGVAPVLTRTTTLDRFVGAVPAVLQGRSLPLPLRIALRDNGLLATSEAGFFDVGRDGAARFHLVRSEGIPPLVLPMALDDDSDQDIVSIGLVPLETPFDDDAGNLALAGPVLTVWEREADGRLERRTQLEMSHASFSVVFARTDYDRDGDEDLLTFDVRGTLIALRYDGAFVFTEVVLRAPEATLFGALAIVAEDRNGDGAVDVVVIGASSLLGEEGALKMEARVLLGDGAGRFDGPATVSEFSTFFEPLGLQFGDITGDGLSDLVVRAHNRPAPAVRVSQSIDALRFGEAVQVLESSNGFTLSDVDGDGALDIASYYEDRLTVLQARGELELEPVSFELPTHWLNAIAIEGASAEQPARLHALYHASCRPPCGESCELSCIFEACVDCIAHSDCGEGAACVEGECKRR
jgi:hypothetical protein